MLVGSYCHLRREGIEGYISDFNNMVKDLWVALGDIGVEILPYVPVVYRGIDKIGGEMLDGVRKWIEWVTEKSGRGSILELGKTAGEEYSWRESSWAIYRPSMMNMTNKEWKGEDKEWRNKGNRIDYVRRERTEVELRRMVPPKELGKMEEQLKEGDEDTDVEEESRTNFGKGRSVEAE